MMKKILASLVLISSLTWLSSCGREKLTPAYKTITINELKNDKPIHFSYKVDETQIDEYAKNAAKFPLFGKLFKAIAVVLANTSISKEGGHELELDGVDVDLSMLSEIDFNLIDYINLDSLVLNLQNAKNRDSLTFIEKIELYVKLDSPMASLPVDDKGYSLILGFDSKKDKLGCDGQCLKLSIASVDWKMLLQTNKLVHLRPKLIINSVPKSTMKLAGSVDFSVKFNLGF